MSECTEWLKAYLAAKILPCEQVRQAAFNAGFSKRDLQIARAELGIIPGSVTTWELPENEIPKRLGI